MNDQEIIDLQSIGNGQQIQRLRAIVKRLRAPDGCSWDRVQTHDTLLSYLIEETYEVVDAIRSADYENLREELGDLLLQVVFHSELADEAGRHDLEDVAYTVSEKLIRRHPHVFSSQVALDPAGVLTQWDQIKRQEKGEELDLPYLHKVGEGLPPLSAARKIQKKAAKVGFDWEDAAPIVDKVQEELNEVRAELESGNEPALEEELGDLLFSVVNLTRKLNKDPELLLHEANQKFISRFTHMDTLLQSQERDLNTATLSEMEAAWGEAKAQEKA